MKKSKETTESATGTQTERAVVETKDAQHVYNFARPMRHSRHHRVGRGGGKARQHGQPYNKRKYGEEEILGTGLQRKVLNWMKRFLLQKYIRHHTSVLDLCCGRGQDLYKYHHQRVNRLIMVDVADHELQLAKTAYQEVEAFKTTLGRDKPPTFVPSDLRLNSLTLQPKVDTVCCQLALHYLWGQSHHIHNFFTTVTSSLRPQGFLLLTVLDADKIPKEGMENHPYMWFSPTYEYKHQQKEDGKEHNNTQQENETIKHAYKFTYKGRITQAVEEFIVPKTELLSQCEAHSLKWIQDYNVDDVREAIYAFHVNKEIPLQLSNDDWIALRLYRCYAFQYIPK